MGPQHTFNSPHLPTLTFPYISFTFPTPHHTFLHLLSYLFPHPSFLPPHPNTFSYNPHISFHLLKVWRSYHVTKFLWRSYWQPSNISILLPQNNNEFLNQTKAVVGNCFSQRATCGKTMFFPGRIIRWIEFNMFNNYYCQGRSDWKAKKKGLHTPQMSCFPSKISVKQWRSEKLQRGAIIFTYF